MKKKIRTIGYISPVIFFLGLGIYYINGLWDILSVGLTLAGAAAGILYLTVCFDDLRQVFSLRSFRSGTNTLLVVCLVLSLLVIANMIFYGHNYTWKDITKVKKYQLSQLTVNILDQVAGLKRDIHITAFFWQQYDRNLSREQNESLILLNQRRERDLGDLLAVYQGINPNVQYRFVDPNRDQLLAREYNIQRYRDNVTVVECGSRKEMVPDLSTEEQLTNTLIKVMSEELPKVYFLEGHQEWDIEDGSTRGYLMAALAIEDQSYQPERLNVVTQGGVPADCKCLVIAGPRISLLGEEINLIDNYLEKGGRVMVCLDPEYDTGLNDWLLAWGIRVGKDMVVDNSAAGVRQGAGPQEPLLFSYDKDHPITSQLKKAFTTMPTVRSVSLLEPQPEGLALTILARTSENSWGETDQASFRIKTPTFDPKDLSGPVPVAVAVTKKLREDKPGLQEFKMERGAGTYSRDEIQKTLLEKSTRQSQLVVFGDSQFASNSYFRYGGNRDLFMNALNWLIGDERLVSIRPKNPEDQTIYINQRQAKVMAMTVKYGLPLVVLILGIWVWVMRRR